MFKGTNMKLWALTISVLLLTGCATGTDYSMYIDAQKSISKDNTMSQTACWAAVNEIAKNGTDGVKINAISLAEKCKNDTMKIEPPKKGLFGF